MYLIPHTDEPLQSQNFTHMGYDLTLITRWNSVVGFWNFDLFDNLNQQWITQGEAFAVGSPSLISTSFPFVFVMIDESDLGIAPQERQDMGQRVNVYIVNKEDYRAAVRASVSIDYRE